LHVEHAVVAGTCQDVITPGAEHAVSFTVVGRVILSDVVSVRA